MTLEDYLEEYDTNKLEVRRTTLEKYQTEIKMLRGFIDNWFNLIPNENSFSEAADSISGIMLLNSWRLANTITCEILSGEYFEAIRNLRFIFEGIVHAVLLENVVGSLPYEERESLVPLPAKACLLYTWEECRKRKISAENPETSEIEEAVLDAMSNQTELISIDQAPKLIRSLARVLSDKRMYTSTIRMLELCGGTLRLDSRDVQLIKKLWRDLSRYQHFSYPYLETIIKRPELCFTEKLDDTLFTRSFNFYFKVMDYFYATLAWRFKDLRNKIKEMCDNWQKQYKTQLSLTSAIVKNEVTTNPKS